MSRLSAQLDSAASGLTTFARQLSECEHFAAVMVRPLADDPRSLTTVWSGPLATRTIEATTAYATAVSPAEASLAAASATCTSWAGLARSLAGDALHIESTIDSLTSTIGGLALADPLIVSELQTEQRQHQSNLDELHQRWRKVCADSAAGLGVPLAHLTAITLASVAPLGAPTGPAFAAAYRLAWASSTAITQMARLRNDPTAAAAWWKSMTEDQRQALVATRQDLFNSGVFAPLANSWKMSLSSDDLRSLYQMRALFKAGINPGTWDPSLGVDANRATIEAVYQYYANLYKSNPGTFWWAGMASMVGASFYGGFEDLSDIRGMTETIRRIADVSGEMPGMPTGFSELASMSAAELANELKFYETALLRMQKKIFLDMGAAHEAYLDGGMATITRFYADDPYNGGPASIQAWGMIDKGRTSGDTSLVEQGNGALLYREQWKVIKPDYDDMRNHPVTGEAMTYLMTLAGAPSIPGAHTFAEVFPVTVGGQVEVGTPHSIFGIPLPHASCEADAHLGTPLPSVNVSSAGSRWALIQQDTLPTWVDLARNHPDQVIKQLDIPIATRAGDYRIIHRLDDILSTWSVSAGAGCSVGFG